MNINVIILVIILLAYLAFALIGLIFINKFSTLDQIFIRNNKRLATILSIMRGTYSGSKESLRSINELKQNLQLAQKEEFTNNKTILQIEQQETKNLHNHNDVRRKEAAVYLGMIATPQARQALEKALPLEKDASVRVYISNALTDILDPASLPVMIDGLIGSYRWYRSRAVSNILSFGREFDPHFERLKETTHIELIELLIRYAGVNYTEQTKAYLFNFVDSFDLIKQRLITNYENQGLSKKYPAKFISSELEDLLTETCRSLSNIYFADFGKAPYIDSANPTVKRNAYWALSNTSSTENFKLLLSRLREDQFARILSIRLSSMIETNPRFLYLVEDAFDQEYDPRIKARLAQVFANRIEYYILQLNSKNAARAREIIHIILNNQRVNELIGFINLNKDKTVDANLAKIIAEQVDPQSKLGIELRTYLNAEFIQLCGFTPFDVDKNKRVHLKDQGLVKAVSTTIGLGFFLFPLYFLLRYFGYLPTAGWLNLLMRYTIEYNTVLIYYTTALALTTTFLMLLSYVNVKNQARLWNLKNISMLFRPNMIPSISIVAPAYNEEKNIVTSVRSLLNLKYPNFELIVVNDGSTDNTLNSLIVTFQLIRSEYYYTESLPTMAIRGIYRNPSYPNLVVVDKANGGKADSLNAGINVANKDYYCGIDCDSLLEPEALLKLASLTLDKSVETPALGGNILPVNSCKVEDGQLVERHVPNNVLARFQTIEYIRAFMIGRLGWQQLNSLLIISGAFGLFRKDRIIGIGGYLTSHGKYHKDTVGEDMELVVRISRLLREIKQPFEILYAFNANCWTEVPEDIGSLKNQRYRWQRGLVDILFYHRQMMFNRGYGLTGIFAMPYYLLFETLGPLFEIQGYILIAVAAFFNILDINIALLLFISTVLLGVINSLVALLIAEREEQLYSIGDLLRLTFLAIIENFGPRQFVSLWRFLGEVNIIFGAGGWGSLERKGIEKV